MIVNRLTYATWCLSVVVWILMMVAILLFCAPSQDPGQVVVNDGDTELRVIVDERRGVACYYLTGSADIDCVPISQLKAVSR